MKQLNRKQKQIVGAMQSSAGRFFGLTTSNGNVYNAQFRGETPAYVSVYDRNHGKTHRIKKQSLSGFSLGATVI